MKKRLIPVLAAVLLWGLTGCDESLPTSSSDDLFPSPPRTVEIRLPWDAFATGFQVFGGFSSPFELGGGVLAHEYKGVLEARTLGRVLALTRTVTVVDTLGSTVLDTLGSIRNGRVVAHFDTLNPSVPESMTVSVHQLLTPWDPISTSWAMAVDTLGDRRPWPEPGAGPARLIATGQWKRGDGDSLVVPVDSATLTSLMDTLEVGRGLRMDMETPDTRLEIGDMFLRYDVVPSVNPDTVVTLSADSDTTTFIYNPPPDAPADGFRVGGAPAWRTTITTQIPRTLTGPSSLCSLVGCPFALTADNVSHASVVLETRPSAAPFQPTDSTRIDVRAVLAPDRLPKAPLSTSFFANSPLPGLTIDGAAFREGGSTLVGVPITDFIQSVLRGASEGEPDPPETLALLAAFEPFSISFAEFTGPGEVGAPYLRLIVTVADSVRLP